MADVLHSPAVNLACQLSPAADKPSRGLWPASCQNPTSRRWLGRWRTEPHGRLHWEIFRRLEPPGVVFPVNDNLHRAEGIYRCARRRDNGVAARGASAAECTTHWRADDAS
jgi:hypothetical protein